MGSGESSIELDFTQRELSAFSKSSGTDVKLMVGYDTIDQRLGLYQDLFQRKSPDPDICKLDTIWAGALAGDLIDLRPFLDEELTAIDGSLLRSFTVDGRLIGVPVFVDIPALYYRTDLLRKYGYSKPPTTWDELGRMAAVIQSGERAAGNRKFWGYLWQGLESEALTCDALEWQMSEGGGNIIENDGTVRLANEHALRAFTRAASWVGSISPPAVLEYDESDSQNIWENGNAAFFRSWLDAYGQSELPTTAVHGKFAAAPIPAGAKGGNWTFGGMALGVSKYSRHPKEALAAIRYLVSAPVQRRRALAVGQIPTRTSLFLDERLLVGTAFQGPLGKHWRTGMCWRPSMIAKADYSLVSHIYAKAVHDILSHKVPALQALMQAQGTLQAIRWEARHDGTSARVVPIRRSE